MISRTPPGAWASGDIDELVRQVAAAVAPGGAVLAVGIDGGISGAIAALLFDLSPGAAAVRCGGVLDLPTVADPGDRTAKRQRVDAGELFRWLCMLAAASGSSGVIVVTERFMPIPSRRGASMHADNPDAAVKKMRGIEASTVRLAGTCGRVEAAVECAQRAYVQVRIGPSPTPQTWRAALHLPVSLDKEHARGVARSMYPALAHRLTAKTHHNRAEALLIATYAPRIGGSDARQRRAKVTAS